MELAPAPLAFSPAETSPVQLAQAISQALDYLHEHQFPNGDFCCYTTLAEADMQGLCDIDHLVFPTALVAECLLSSLPDPRADAMLTRATTFLQGQMHYGGLWNHFATNNKFSKLCPLDVDDTSCVSAVLRARGIECPRPSNVPLLLANRNRQGLFYSWFLLRLRPNPRPAYWRIVLPELLRPVQTTLFWQTVEANRGDVDAVVNANALYYLGERPETQPVIDWLLRIIAEGHEADCDLWYRDAHAVYYFISRNYYAGVTRLEPARQPVVARVLASARPDGSLGNSILDTALGISTLLHWRVCPPELPRAVAYLLSQQTRFGNWPRRILYYGGPKRARGWGSEELTTAFCLEALQRYQQLLEKST